MVFCFQLLVPGLLFLALCFGLSAFGFPDLTSWSWLLGLGYLALVLQDCVPQVLFVVGMAVLLDRGARVPRMVAHSWWLVYRMFLSLLDLVWLVGTR